MAAQSVTQQFQVLLASLVRIGSRVSHLRYRGVLAFVLIVGAIVSRRPDAVFTPQPWAEEGCILMEDAFKFGPLHALLYPSMGYFVTYTRLLAGLSIMLPLRWAPLLMTLVAILIQASPALLLLSRRFAHVGSLGARLLAACLLLAIPTASGVHATLLNSSVFMALLAFLILVAGSPETTAWRWFDAIVLSLMGLTGPFVLLAFPVALLVFALRRRSWDGVRLAIIGSCTAIQGLAMVFASGARSKAPLGASFELLARIIGRNVVLLPVFGPEFLGRHPGVVDALYAGAFVVALLVLAYGVRVGSFELRLLLCFAVLLLAATLLFPQASLTGSQWAVLGTGAGARYWVIPGASFLWAVLWMACRQKTSVVVRVTAALLLATALYTGVRHWRYPPFTNFDFPKYARQFEALPAGQKLSIPINPPGWKMTLRKR